jgi:4-hydroxybenzoate polyprenyltransferase
MIRKKIIAYLQLLRFHAAASESVLILLGALLMRLHDLFMLSILFLIGLFYHIYGYVLNDYVDINLDRQSLDLSKKPLVSGMIPKEHALFLILSGLIGGYILAFIYIRTIIPLCLFSLAILFGGVYDLYGKKIPGISDFIIAGSLTFAFFFGASTVSSYFSVPVYLTGLLIFVAIVFVNVIEGGLKDVDHDYLAGGKTLAILLGVKVQENRLLITKKFIGFGYGLIGVCFLLALFLFMQPEIDIFHGKFIEPILVIVLLVIIFVLSVRFFQLKVFDRSKIKRMYAVINGLAGVLLFFGIYPIIGLTALVVLLALPATWYILFNMVLYKKPLQPGV